MKSNPLNSLALIIIVIIIAVTFLSVYEKGNTDTYYIQEFRGKYYLKRNSFNATTVYSSTNIDSVILIKNKLGGDDE